LKKKYIKPTLEINMFEISDSITTSLYGFTLLEMEELGIDWSIINK